VLDAHVADPARRRPLKVGLFLPFAEQQHDGSSPRWSDFATLARLAEDVGFDSLWMPDHLLFRFEGQATRGPWECWSVLSALAAVTRRITLGTVVVCTSFRNPALLAKMAETVDEISGGRLILGLGAGYLEAEYNAFGFPYDHRVGRFEEALTIIHTLLRTGEIDFDGRFYQARDCELRPRGPRNGQIPILIGSTGERMLGLVARYADIWNGWLIFGRSQPDGVVPFRESVDAACHAAGRDPATLARTFGVLAAPTGLTTPPRGSARPDAPVTPITGSPAEMAETLRGFAREGVSEVQVYLNPTSPAGVEAFAPVLAELDRG
jgi:probable F420-dependent oxidoreductase